MDPDVYIRSLAARSLARDDAVGWWDTLYVAAGQGETEIPWDRGGPHAHLASWPGVSGSGRAVVVGAGLGGDAEFLAARGRRTTAFDISPAAVETARSRFPGSAVDYVVADLLDLPPALVGAFDLVVESMTVQALPRSYRTRAIAAVRSLLRPGGTLLVIAAATASVPSGPEEGPPWPLTRSELSSFAGPGLEVVSIEEFSEPERHRWRAEFRALSA